ncbi:hypothetical protein [Nostoc sp. 106C]|nr:hypothetical protein [Nostoc sp. 106C]
MKICSSGYEYILPAMLTLKTVCATIDIFSSDTGLLAATREISFL